MRSAHFLALAATWIFVSSGLAQNSSLGQLEQGLQRPGATGSTATAQEPGYLGFIPNEETDQGRGVRVESVKPSAPAAQGGMQANDLITAVDGKTVTNLDQLDAILTKMLANQKVAITVDRNGLKQTLNITLGTKPKPAGSEPAAAAPTTGAPALTLPTSPSTSSPGTSSPASPSTAPSLTAPGPAPSTTAPSLTAPGSATPGFAPSLQPPTGSSSPATLPAPGAVDSSPRSSGIVAQPQITPASPSEPAATNSVVSGRASLGVRLPQPGTAAARQQRGALIESVNKGSPAEQAGLKPGQTIVGVDSERIENDDDLIAAIRARQPGQTVRLQYQDSPAGEIHTATIRLAQAGGPAAQGGATPGNLTPPRPGALGGGIGGALPGNVGPGAGRPLLDRIERLADNLAPRPASTVYDPEAFAALRAQVNMLENRIKALESKLNMPSSTTPGAFGGTTPGLSAPGITPPGTTPGFGSPSAPPTTPGFGAPAGTSP